MQPADDTDAPGDDFGDDFADPDWYPPEPKPTVPARLVDLVFLLTRRSCTLAEIRTRFEEMGEYTGSNDTARQKFRRDRAKLRLLGIDVVEQDDTYHIPTPSRVLSRPLAQDEKAAVALACRRVLPSVSPEVRRALCVGLVKIGAEATLDDAPWESRVPAPPTLLPVLAACGTRALRIGYTNAAGEHTERTLHPWAVRCTEDSWYARAWDERTGSARTFKLDRIDPDPELLPPTTPVVGAPDVAVAVSELNANPWEWGDAEPHEVVLRLGGDRPDRVLPEGAVLDDDSATEAPTARLLARDDANLATTILRLGADVTVLSPASARNAVVARLDATLETLSRPVAAPVGLEPYRPDRHRPQPDVTHTERLLRLIGIAHTGGRPDARFDADDLCRTLQCTPEELRDDMALLTHWCGVPPFLGGETVTAYKDDGEVSLTTTRLPLVASLTDREAAALAVAVRLAAEVESDPGLSALLDGVLGALGVDPQAFSVQRPHVDVVAAEGSAAAALATAIATERCCEIEHRSPGREPRRRVVDPWRLGNARGRLYLSAFDHDAGAVRMFRVDRIDDVVVLEDPICHAQDVEIPADANRITGTGDVEVVVSIPDDHVAWAAGRYGSDAVSVLPTGGHFLVLPSGDVDRLAPTLLALAPRCEVVSPPEARAAVSALATELRRRYGA